MDMLMYTRIALIYTLVVVLVIAAYRYRRTWWAQELLRPYGAKPSRRFAPLRRRDFFRSAGIAAGLCIGFLVLSGVMLRVAETYPLNSRAEQTFMQYFFMSVLLSLVALVSAVVIVVRAVMLRKRPTPSFAIFAGEIEIGYTELEYRDSESGVLWGVVTPTEDYVQIEREFREAASGDAGPEYTVVRKLADLSFRHDLRIVGADGPVPAAHILLIDTSPDDYHPTIRIEAVMEQSICSSSTPAPTSP